MIRLSTLILLAALPQALTQIDAHPSSAQESKQAGDPIVIEVIQLDHADAHHLASVLAPFLTKEGRIVADGHTNSLIIRDRKSRVESLVRIIKGGSDP